MLKPLLAILLAACAAPAAAQPHDAVRPAASAF